MNITSPIDIKHIYDKVIFCEGKLAEEKKLKEGYDVLHHRLSQCEADRTNLWKDTDKPNKYIKPTESLPNGDEETIHSSKYSRSNNNFVDINIIDNEENISFLDEEETLEDYYEEVLSDEEVEMSDEAEC